MLILVAVTVSYSIKSGLLTKAKNATSGYTYQEEEDEIGQIRLSYLADKESKEITETLKERLKSELTGEAIVEISGENIIVTYNKTQNQHTIQDGEEENKINLSGTYYEFLSTGIQSTVYTTLTEDYIIIYGEQYKYYADTESNIIYVIVEETSMPFLYYDIIYSNDGSVQNIILSGDTILGVLNDKMIVATDLKGTWKQDNSGVTREYPNEYYSVTYPFYWVGDRLYGDVGDQNVLFLHSISEDKKSVKYRTSDTWRRID